MTGFNSKREASYAKLNTKTTIVHYKEDSYKVPKCFNSVVEWRDWQKAARVLNPGSSGYCTDCTFKYKNKMVKRKYVVSFSKQLSLNLLKMER